MKLAAIAVLTTSCSTPSPAFQCCGGDFAEAVYLQPAYTGPLHESHLEIAATLLEQPGMPAGATANDVAVALVDHTASQAFWDRAREASTTTKVIRQTAQRIGLSEAAVGAAYLRSTLERGSISPECEAGVWQLPLDQAGLRIEQCRTRDRALWDGQTPSTNARGCQVLFCDVDERMDLERSTVAVLQGDWMAGLSASRVIAVYALLTCVTDSPLPVCEHIRMAPTPTSVNQ